MDIRRPKKLPAATGLAVIASVLSMWARSLARCLPTIRLLASKRCLSRVQFLFTLRTANDTRRMRATPSDLLSHAAILSGYAKGQHLVTKVYVEDNGGHDAAVEQLLQRTDIDYIEVRDKVAGCFDFRIERATNGKAASGPEKELKC